MLLKAIDMPMVFASNSSGIVLNSLSLQLYVNPFWSSPLLMHSSEDCNPCPAKLDDTVFLIAKFIYDKNITMTLSSINVR